MNTFVVLSPLGCSKVTSTFSAFKTVALTVVTCGGWSLFRVNSTVGEGLLVTVLAPTGVKILGIFPTGISSLLGDNTFGPAVSISSTQAVTNTFKYIYHASLHDEKTYLITLQC